MPSLRDYRRLLARHLGGGLRVGTPTNNSTLAYLEDVTLRSSIDQGDQYNQFWLYRPQTLAAADRLRQVDHLDLVRGWLFPDFAPGEQYVSAPSASESYELLSPWFSPLDLHAFINQALRQCLVAAELGVAADPAKRRQLVSATHPWLADPSAVAQIGLLPAGADRDLTDPYQPPLRATLERGSAGAGFGSGTVDLYVATPGHLPGTRVSTSLSTSLPLAAATASVTQAAGLPTIYPYTVAIEQELCVVTALAAPNQLALTRGAFSTARALHPGGAAVVSTPLLTLRGLYPAAALVLHSDGTLGGDEGMVSDFDLAQPSTAWMAAAGLAEAWRSAPQVVEQLAEQQRVMNMREAATIAARWQVAERERAGVGWAREARTPEVVG